MTPFFHTSVCHRVVICSEKIMNIWEIMNYLEETHIKYQIDKIDNLFLLNLLSLLSHFQNPNGKHRVWNTLHRA